jgi:hypothetical protein
LNLASACHHLAWKGDALTQRFVEIVIGRLVTDDDVRETLVSSPHRALEELLEHGTHLTHVEIAALIATDSMLWEQAAAYVDARLRKSPVGEEP